MPNSKKSKTTVKEDKMEVTFLTIFSPKEGDNEKSDIYVNEIEVIINY